MDDIRTSDGTWLFQIDEDEADEDAGAVLEICRCLYHEDGRPMSGVWEQVSTVTADQLASALRQAGLLPE